MEVLADLFDPYITKSSPYMVTSTGFPDPFVQLRRHPYLIRQRITTVGLVVGFYK